MSQPYLAHIDRRKFGIAFYTIVVRNQAVVEKYPGGLPAFVSKHRATCNNDITVCCFMGDDVDELYHDLVDNGFKRREDFAFFDISREIMWLEGDQRIVSHVPWMRCEYKGGRAFVWYHDGTMTVEEAIQEKLLEFGIDPANIDPESYRVLQGRWIDKAGEVGLEAALEMLGQELLAAD